MSLLHNIRQFAETELQGVIPWSKFSFPDEVKSDVANVSIEGNAGLYRVVVSSSYAVPPLGWVQFTDHAAGHLIDGDNQAGTWHRIAGYLKAREAGDTVITPSVAAAIVEMLPTAAKIAPLPVNELPIPPVPMVWYIADPGVWYQNGPALVTRINADGSYNLTVVPDGSEPFYRQNVQERSDGLRNVCWVSYPVTASDALHAQAAKLGDIEDAIANPSDTLLLDIADLKTAVAELTETISRIKASAFDQRKSA
jgi:hypothetical protein